MRFRRKFSLRKWQIVTNLSLWRNIAKKDVFGFANGQKVQIGSSLHFLRHLVSHSQYAKLQASRALLGECYNDYFGHTNRRHYGLACPSVRLSVCLSVCPPICLLFLSRTGS